MLEHQDKTKFSNLYENPVNLPFQIIFAKHEEIKKSYPKNFNQIRQIFNSSLFFFSHY